MDGNTRLCTATAAAALKESFGSDGQPGSLHRHRPLRRDLPVGHNMAETQTVLWTRILDRLARPGPAAVRRASTRARRRSPREADVHLAPRAGHEPGADERPAPRAASRNGWIDDDYVDAHTVGFDELRRRVEPYTPERVARDLRRRRPTTSRAAARIFGTSRAAGLDRAPGRLPVAPGDRRGRAR